MLAMGRGWGWSWRGCKADGSCIVVCCERKYLFSAFLPNCTKSFPTPPIDRTPPIPIPSPPSYPSFYLSIFPSFHLSSLALDLSIFLSTSLTTPTQDTLPHRKKL
eukprot:c16966_g1_i1.p2 GENE.c16966_g1_i1~~c16966_g1_i1.p2  ORF type:complete len:105 (+),score=2.35 c16966_g1_i1:260-574(+)